MNVRSSKVMKIQDLKKAWDKLPSAEEMDEEQIRKLLHHRTMSMFDRIERNIRIGFIVLFFLVLLFILDDFIYAPFLLGNLGVDYQVPGWIKIIDIIFNLFIISTFVYFVVKYYRIRTRCNLSCNLRETLVKIIDTLRVYKRLFYMALAILSLILALAFIYGLYMGMVLGFEQRGYMISEIPAGGWILAGGIVVIIFAALIGGIYWVMHWGFVRLYGNYIEKLKNTLKELDEIDQ